jgi:hypothetical protein
VVLIVLVEVAIVLVVLVPVVVFVMFFLVIVVVMAVVFVVVIVVVFVVIVLVLAVIEAIVNSSGVGYRVVVVLIVPMLVKKTKLHGLSPRANYTDRATAACRRSDCQLLRISGQCDGSQTH